MWRKFLSLLAFLPIIASAKVETLPVEIFPKAVNTKCGDGLAQIYDECGNQLDILEQAQKIAHQQNKRVLIVYGAEWCIWDHVFNKHIQGVIGNFNYQWRASSGNFEKWHMKEKVSSSDYDDAKALNHFVANNFVIAHIEDEKANGKDVLKKIGNNEDIFFYPNIMVLDKNGKFVDSLPPTGTIDGLQIRQSYGQEYRGYNRKILLEQLQGLRKLAD